MDQRNQFVALFDFDGVVMDTEGQYSIFWHQQGVDYLGIPDLDVRIKGQTLTNIYQSYFNHMPEEQRVITAKLQDFEERMSFNYIPGLQDFVRELRTHQVKVGVVTSSTQDKMNKVYRAHPEFKGLFNEILTSEMFKASKPDPDCFLLGMRTFGADAHHTFVFEDSINGLKAGMASGATVVGLATTNSRTVIEPFSHLVIDDFLDFNYDKMLEVYK